MRDCGSPNSTSHDLTAKKVSWVLWYIPVALLLFYSQVGIGEGRVWLWIQALLVMGGGCLANATRCGAALLLQGPLYILAALYVALSMFGVVPLNPGLFLLIVLNTTGRDSRPRSTSPRFHRSALAGAVSFRFVVLRT